MDSAALDELPVALAVAIRLRRSGAPNELIATALGIEAPSVDELVERAQSKLQRLLATGDVGGGRT